MASDLCEHVSILLHSSTEYAFYNLFLAPGLVPGLGALLSGVLSLVWVTDKTQRNSAVQSMW